MSVPVILVNQECIWWNGNCCFLRKCSSSIGKPLFGEESLYSNDPLLKVCHVNPALAQKSPRLSMSTNFSRKPAASSGVCCLRNVVETLSIRYLNRLAVDAPVNLLTNLSVSPHVLFPSSFTQQLCLHKKLVGDLHVLYFFSSTSARLQESTLEVFESVTPYIKVYGERERKKSSPVCVTSVHVVMFAIKFYKFVFVFLVNLKDWGSN